MFTLDAELRSERCTFSDQKNKIRSQERVKDFTANGKKNEKTDRGNDKKLYRRCSQSYLQV